MSVYYVVLKFTLEEGTKKYHGTLYGKPMHFGIKDRKYELKVLVLRKVFKVNVFCTGPINMIIMIALHYCIY